jgi:flagellar biosynthesis/type III secretory pathway protein FliH
MTMPSSFSPGVFAPVAATVAHWAPEDLAEAAPGTNAPSAPAPDPVGDAFALGFSGGRIEGEQAERARLRTALRASEEALLVLSSSDTRWTGAAKENLTVLATAIARQIVDREVLLDPAIVERLVVRALAEFPVDQPVRLRVNPDDFAIIESVARVEDEAPGAPRTTWTADPRVSRGGCVVEGRERIVDGRVETALERVYRRLARTDD